NDGRVTIQPIQGRRNHMLDGSSRPITSGSRGTSRRQRVIVCYNCKGEGHIAKQCTKPKRKRDTEWFKDKSFVPLMEGEWIDNLARVKYEFYHHFSNRFAQPDWDRVPLVDQFPRVLSSDFSCNLEAVVSSDEIKKAIWDCGSDKTPGPDVTTHYLPKEREAASAKPHHVIASSNSSNSLKNMPRFSSNDMVHNQYLEEAKNKTHDKGRDSKPSVMPSARSQSTANGSKPNPRINNQKIFNAKHDSCVTKFLKEVNSCAKVSSNKTTNRNKPVKQTSFAKKPERQIPKGHRFSIKKTSVVHEKTMTPRSCLRWKPMGKIFKTVGLSSELRIHDHSNEPSSSKLVPKVVPPAHKKTTS
nr:transposon TX1 uncharacterized [Tanacetum cinerariifolium]